MSTTTRPDGDPSDDPAPSAVPRSRTGRLRGALFATLAVVAITAGIFHRYRAPTMPPRSRSVRTGPEIGADSRLLRRTGARAWLWGRGRVDDPASEWFDITGTPLEPGQFQYGVGKDRIRAIDAPRFAAIDAPELAEDHIEHDTRVIGFVHNGEAKAYPLFILNRHELVNDRVGGKPVTVGW